MTQDRSSFLFLRRATRLRRELYEVLDACKYISLAHLHGGSNVTQMNLEAPSWMTDFRIADALDSFSFFSVFTVGGFHYRFALTIFCVLGSGFEAFLLVSSCSPP